MFDSKFPSCHFEMSLWASNYRVVIKHANRAKHANIAKLVLGWITQTRICRFTRFASFASFRFNLHKSRKLRKSRKYRKITIFYFATSYLCIKMSNELKLIIVLFAIIALFALSALFACFMHITQMPQNYYFCIPHFPHCS